MAFVSVNRAAWDALSLEIREEVLKAVVIPPTGFLTEFPTVWAGEDGEEYYVWDDPLLNEDHALAVASALQNV